MAHFSTRSQVPGVEHGLTPLEQSALWNGIRQFMSAYPRMRRQERIYAAGHRVMLGCCVVLLVLITGVGMGFSSSLAFQEEAAAFQPQTEGPETILPCTEAVTPLSREEPSMACADI